MTDKSLLFVRTEMLPQERPPATQRGVVKWLMENLFSSPMNAVLTVLGVIVTYMLIKAALPWFLQGVWSAKSLGECRQIIEANFGPGEHGACWAMIKERWNQFIFGFYPKEMYWRPILAFALMFVALAPVLYYGIRRSNLIMVGSVAVLLVLALVGVKTDIGHVVLAAVVMLALTVVAYVAPKKLVWVTALFPAVGFFLLWGGSVWGPIGVIAGFGILAGVWLALQVRLGVVDRKSVV